MKLPFKTHNKHAAKAERERHYQHASKLWQKAAELTCRELNKHWCLSRAEWCEKMHLEDMKLKVRKIYVPHKHILRTHD
jgi:hypothetical protein